ncbi:tRNA synthetases class I, catalytic domain-domain-containing protein [Lobosporangium transversale]|uniref:glutamine--tRNA ligase n=1 Tax=Lobosporangium transversale TaxID=64571 RepID=A0A1Y2GMB7_9FUNG|nr:tRNA synthetases class I, catalytic domain-domain-containing protein [Lobosporangium transversale]ORZ15489.1 tRNA synthetases class I, catalytic domain-domain-containing protein [Lobosporangium transversale]|eukprot:XP_021881237.1 tRNA synthetases class I, catalytic domain-domain-containing protein [Lobosporangium transversale]
MSDQLVTLFQNIGLTEQKAKETAKNKNLAPMLERTIHSAGFQDKPSEKTTGALLYHLASTITPSAVPHLDYIARAIRDSKLTTSDQVSAAIKYASDKKEIDEAAFNEECGVGVVVTKEDVVKAVNEYTETVKDKLIKDRYKFFGMFFAGAKNIPSLKWANGGDIKEAVDAKMLEVLGPKDERDVVVKKKKEAKPEVKKEKVEETASSSVLTVPDMFFEGELAKLHKPGGNPQIKPELMEEHLKATGGKYVTRFPPEPNGFLHIGHAKAININFGLAKAHNGICNLRYDDTNPEAEEERYFVSILEIVKWLGFTPSEITYSSTHFQRLYDLAVELIKKDKAYVCHCTAEEIQMHRGGPERGPRTACVHRNRPIEESVKLFEKMKNGGFEEGEAILRMKMDLENGNPQFWDLVAYRVLKTPHHRTGSEWIIYPTYDYTHCLVDSFENITHSLCTVEFTQSRPSYYWLCDALEVYKPVQWEYGRLNVTNTILSKRKIAELVKRGHVFDWDDPRLYTLPAIRRRGVPPQAINNFIHTLGVTKSDTVIEATKLDAFIRDYLNETAPRLMGVFNPIKIVIENLPEGHLEMLTVQNKPRDPSMGEHTIPFTREVWIDGSDFREVDDKDFFRLAPGKTVGLLNVSCPITCTKVMKDDSGKVVELRARYEDAPGFKRPKTYIQWVAESPEHGSPVRLAEVRLFDKLFNHANPQDKREVPGGYLSDINAESLKVEKGALVEIGLWDVMERWTKTSESKTDYEAMRFQLTRIGYFCLDRESDLGEFTKPEISIKDTATKIVLNRTVPLQVSSTLKKQE